MAAMASIRRIYITAVLAEVALLFAIPGCRRDGKGQAHPVHEYVEHEMPYIPNAYSVGFDVAPVSGAQLSSEWIATYRTQGKIARFRIVLEPGKSLSDSGMPGLEMQSGNGRFIPEPGSDASVLLVHLKKVLQAKVLPKNIKRVSSLPFTFVSFGNRESRSSDGGYAADPPGNWMPMKIFLGDGDRESEVFLGLNPALGMGEFSIKDEDYGNGVVAALASVL